jgi:hypothetical protein
MPKRIPAHIVQLIRKRSKIAKKFSAYEKERAYLLKALSELKPPTEKDLEELLKYDLEIKKHTISFHERDNVKENRA